MIFYEKRVGETPLEMLGRLRAEQPELSGEKLSYAGRLDPMAEGVMLVLVGDENKEREKHLGYDKEYEASFLVGISTDSGDVLGLIEEVSRGRVSDAEIEQVIDRMRKVRVQTYPWFSGAVVEGKKLFDHYKSGNTNIRRPERPVSIHSVEYLGTEEIAGSELREYVDKTLQKVGGDFRQSEIAAAWKEALAKEEHTIFQIVTVRLLVSSGTFVRVLAECFPLPTLLYKLMRTRIIL